MFFYTHYYYLPDLHLLTCFILRHYPSTTLVFFLFLKYSNFFCHKAVELDAVLVYYSLLFCALPLSRGWLFVTLWTLACHAPLSMGLFRQEYWSGLPCPPPGDLPKSGIGSWCPPLRQILYHLSCQGNPTGLVSTFPFISTCWSLGWLGLSSCIPSLEKIMKHLVVGLHFLARWIKKSVTKGSSSGRSMAINSALELGRLGLE